MMRLILLSILFGGLGLAMTVGIAMGAVYLLNKMSEKAIERDRMEKDKTK